MMRRKFPIYKNYKNVKHSDIHNIPAHWVEKRVKDIAILERGKFTHRPRNDPQMYDGIYPFIQTGDIAQANKYIMVYKQTLNDNGIKVSKKFKKGTLLMAIAANIGDVAIVKFDTYFPDSIVAIKPYKSDNNYLFYLFSTTKNELNRIKITNTQDNLNLERLNSLVKFVPPLPEQKSISKYLHTKSEQIDQKIKLLIKKSAKYSELKQSLINETVAHGLNKTVAMKDSGIEWIGEIPEYWKVKRFKDYYLCSMGNTILKSELVENGKIPVYSATAEDKYFGFINNSNIILNKDDLVIPARGNSIGYVKMVREKCTLTQTSIACKRQRSICSMYIYYFLMGNRFDIFKFDDTAIPQFTVEDTNSINIPYPPLEEQKAIADYLDTKTAHIDRIVETINIEVEKLKELRKTLINDVVTGKIKVTTEGE